MVITEYVIGVECGECAQDLELDLDKGEIRSNATGMADVVYNEDPEFQGLWMWDCPDCDYADSYFAYGD